MIPFKDKTRGIIKNTTVLLILVCISESFSLLQSSPKNSINLRTFLSEYQRQDPPKEESRNSRNFERETLEISPYIRDVRADSRQSRIDARDIRTDFREIRTELKDAHQITRYQRDSRRVAVERRDKTEDFRKNNDYSQREMKKQLPEKSVRNFLNNRRIAREQTFDQETSRRDSMNNMQTRRVRDMEAISYNQEILNERGENRQEIRVADNGRERSRQNFPQRELTYNKVGQYSVSRQNDQIKNDRRQIQTLRTRHSIIRQDEYAVKDIENNRVYNRDHSNFRQQKSVERENRQTIPQNNQRRENDNFNYLLRRERRNIRVLRDNSRKVQNDNAGPFENRLQFRNNRREQTTSRLLEQRNIFTVSRKFSTFVSNIPIRDYGISKGNSVHLMRRRLGDREILDISNSFRENSERMDRINIQLLRNNGQRERSVRRHTTERIQNRQNDQRLWDSSRQPLLKLEENENRVKLSSGRRNTESYRFIRKNRIVSAQRYNPSDRRLTEYIRTNSQSIRNNRFATNQNGMSDSHIIREDNRKPLDISQVRFQTSLLYKKNRQSRLTDVKLDWARTLRFREESTKNIRSREADRGSISRRSGEQREDRTSRQVDFRSEESKTCLKHRFIIKHGNDFYRISRVHENTKHKRELESQPDDRRIQFNPNSARMMTSDRREINSSQQRRQYTRKETKRTNNGKFEFLKYVLKNKIIFI